MKKKNFKKIENKMIQVSIDLNKLESLSRILIDSLSDPLNLKSWDVENLALILLEKLTATRQKFNDIEVILKLL